MAELLTPFAGDAAPELAADLRARFGSLSHALSASRSQLRGANDRFGDAYELILAARDLVDAAENEKLSGARVDPSDHKMLRYLRSRLCQGREEHFIAIYCDADDGYLADEEMGHGNSATVAIDPAHLFRRALAVNASSLLLAHNHPSGICTPSVNDINATREIASVGQTLGVKILDHLILTSKKAYSMRAGGLM